MILQVVFGRCLSRSLQSAVFLACGLGLWLTSKIKVVTKPGDDTSGHVWDEDIREMNNPLPRWWVWMFVITIIFSLFYLVAYPGAGSYAGKLGWTSANQYDKEVETANKALEPLYAKFAAMTVRRAYLKTLKLKPLVSVCL